MSHKNDEETRYLKEEIEKLQKEKEILQAKIENSQTTISNLKIVPLQPKIPEQFKSAINDDVRKTSYEFYYDIDDNVDDEQIQEYKKDLIEKRKEYEQQLRQHEQKLREYDRQMRLQERKLRKEEIKRKRKLARRKIKEQKKNKAKIKPKTVTLDGLMKDFTYSLVSSFLDSVVESALPDHASDKSLLSVFWRNLENIHVNKDNFIELAENFSQIFSVLSDTQRILVLKILEPKPRYTNELQAEVGMIGGTFKHHIDTLNDAGLISQEQYRGRYLLTPIGRGVLKFLEVLFNRYIGVNEQDQVVSDSGTNDENNLE